MYLRTSIQDGGLIRSGPEPRISGRSLARHSAHSSGVGRSGAILAPIAIGTLVGMALPLQQNFVAIAIPAVIATIAVSLIRHERSASATAGAGRRVLAGAA